MRLISFSVSFILLTLLSAYNAEACSRNHIEEQVSVDELVSQSDYFFTGTVIFSKQTNSPESNREGIARLKIDEVFHSRNTDIPETIDVIFLYPRNCDKRGTTFRAGSKTSLLVSINEIGQFELDFKLAEYDTNSDYVYLDFQWNEYIQKDINSEMLSEGCVREIKSYYDASYFLSESEALKEMNAECISSIQTYDRFLEELGL